MSLFGKMLSGAAALLFVSGITKPLGAADDKITYLALGDSVAFGLNVTILPPPPFTAKPPQPSAFVGYPEVIAQSVKVLAPVTELNASCPGETSTGFITATGPDYGCYSDGPQGQPPFFSWVGLKVKYTGSQLAYAVGELPKKHYNLVTLQIGSNDALLLLKQCNNDVTCVYTGLPAVLGELGSNLTQILTQIRSVYSGRLVLVGYYSPLTELDPVAVALNSTMLAVGLRFGITYADGFAAFQLASAPYGGDPCKAGLLVRLSATTCDIHPSLLGSQVLAQTVMTSVALGL